MTRAEPSRHLYEGHRYTRADFTDIRRTWRRARLLAYLRRDQQTESCAQDAMKDKKQ